ncbi:MAG: flavodoxin family protein [Armatimonadota bacterium]
MASKILGIAGSPRRGSNTEVLVRAALEAAEAEGAESRVFALAEKRVEPCRACHACGKGVEWCIIDDDMTEGLYEDFVWADAIVFGTPVYMGGMSAQLKAVIDRTRPLWIRDNALQNKFASAIAVGEGRWGGQELARQSILHFCMNHGMVLLEPACLPYGSWEVCGQAAEPGDVREDQFAMKAARGLGRRLARTTLVVSEEG